MISLAAVEHLARQTDGELLSVKKWIREGRGVLFPPYRANEIASLRNIISTWMRLAIFESMNAAAGDQRLWFVVDELDALGTIDGLKDALVSTPTPASGEKATVSHPSPRRTPPPSDPREVIVGSKQHQRTIHTAKRRPKTIHPRNRRGDVETACSQPRNRKSRDPV